MQGACHSINKETPAHVFYCEFSEIFRGNFFVGHMQTALLNGLCFMLSQKRKHYFKSNNNCKLSPRHWNTGLMSSRVSLTSWGEGASLVLVGHPSSDGIMIKIMYGVDVLLHQPASHPIFSSFPIPSHPIFSFFLYI